MARRKEISKLTFEILDGFAGTGAIDETTPGAGESTVGVDTFALTDDATIVPVGARFTTEGISTVRTVTATQNSQVWTVTITATGGTMDLILNGETAATIAYDANSATIQAALIALASIETGDVTVAGDGPHTITMAGDYANTSGNTLTVDTTNLTGGSASVATVQDGLSTWEITFSPAWTAGFVPSDDDVITFYPRKVTVKVGTGDISHNKTKDPQIDLDRGLIDGAREGDQQALTVDFAFVYDWLASSTPNVPTVDEVLEREGEAEDWTNAAANPCEPYQVTLKIIDAPNCGSELAEIILYKYFIPTSVNASVEAALVTVSGVCVTTKPIKRRVTNSSDVIEITNS